MKNTPESNGRVGMIGSSYEGFTAVMALEPHPALKVAALESATVEGWMDYIKATQTIYRSVGPRQRCMVAGGRAAPVGQGD